MSSGKWEVDLGKCPSRIGIAQVAGGTSICVRSLDYLQGVSELSEPNAQLQPTRGGGNESLEIPATGVDGLGGKAFRPLWYTFYFLPGHELVGPVGVVGLFVLVMDCRGVPVCLLRTRTPLGRQRVPDIFRMQ